MFKDEKLVGWPADSRVRALDDGKGGTLSSPSSQRRSRCRPSLGHVQLRGPPGGRVGDPIIARRHTLECISASPGMLTNKTAMVLQ